jgi:hypothetical protein
MVHHCLCMVRNWKEGGECVVGIYSLDPFLAFALGQTCAFTEVHPSSQGALFSPLFFPS